MIYNLEDLAEALDIKGDIDVIKPQLRAYVAEHSQTGLDIIFFENGFVLHRDYVASQLILYPCTDEDFRSAIEWTDHIVELWRG